MEDGIESRVLEPLNKILARKSLRICAIEDGGVCICDESNIVTQYWSWDSLGSMLFASDEHLYYLLPEYCDMTVDYRDPCRRKLEQLGLIDVIRESMSFEELALKLEIMA